MTQRLIARDGQLRVVVRGINPHARACGGCTACCTALHVDELHKPAGARCAHLRAARGCSKYEDRPPSCREFQCLWLRGLHATREEHRPDRVGLMLVPTTEPRTIEARELRTGAADSVEGMFLVQDLRDAGLNVRIVPPPPPRTTPLTVHRARPAQDQAPSVGS